jgi:hypothetical protein
MESYLGQVWDMLMGRGSGPLGFRFVIQPLVATVLGIRAGLKDARAGRPAYGWTVVTQSGTRRALLLEGWGNVGRLFLAAVGIDVIYEIIVFRWVYPGQALIVATALALPPYFLIRGLTNRFVSWRLRSDETRSNL